LPVKLRVYDSIFVPLAKWAMLLAGNYRHRDQGRYADRAGSGSHGHRKPRRSVYNFVNDLCVKLGAKSRRSRCRSRNTAAAAPEPDPSSVGGTPRYRMAHRTSNCGRQAGAAHRQAEGA